MNNLAKYRAWHKEEERMFDVFGFDVNHIYPYTTDEIISPPDWDDVEIMQYIGIDDIDNKPIYEGDIVDCLRAGDTEWTERVVINDIRSLPRALFGSSLISRKVVGNIKEHPYLLKE